MMAVLGCNARGTMRATGGAGLGVAGCGAPNGPPADATRPGGVTWLVCRLPLARVTRQAAVFCRLPAAVNTRHLTNTGKMIV